MEFNYKIQPGMNLQKTAYEVGAKPLITIVTPFYNAGTYFEQTFQSVMNQTFPWFEWIIVDDGSTCTTDVSLLKKLVATDERVRIVWQQNAGVSVARNTGFSQATTDLVVPIDADDLIEAVYLEYVYWGMYYNPDAAWCYTDSVGFQNIEYTWQIPWNATELKKHNFLSSIAAIRKRDFQEIDGYKTKEQAFFEDWYFWLEMLEKSKKPVHLQEILFWYRRTDSGLLSSIEKADEKSEFSQKVIEEIAQTADGTVKAKEYPLVGSADREHTPKKFSLGTEYKVKKETGKKHVLVLVDDSIEEKGHALTESDLSVWVEDNTCTVMLTGYETQNLRQDMHPYTENVYMLADFLDPAYYVDFVSYYIISRDIDTVVACGQGYSRYMTPLLETYFPQMEFIQTEIQNNLGESVQEQMYKLYREAADQAHMVDIMEKEKHTFMGRTITSDDPDMDLICTVLKQYEEILNRHEEVVNRHEEVINRHEEVVNRHEEAINRHEEVVNRHETVINEDWAWLKSLEQRVTTLEDGKH